MKNNSSKSLNIDRALKYFDSEELVAHVDFFRSIGEETTQEPDAILKYINSPAVGALIDQRHSNCVQRARLFEALSYGSIDAALACPGPSLSGILVRELGNKEQQDRFFTHVLESKARTFLAVTEPLKGSDAGKMAANLDEDNCLQGSKWLVGNAVDASVGCAIVRRGSGPLGLIAVMLDTQILSQAEVRRSLIPMSALKGARLSRVDFSGVKIPQENILGEHLPPLKQGLFGMMRTFNQMRPIVAAVALGHGLALLDYVEDCVGLVSSELSNIRFKISVARDYNYKVAKMVDEDATNHVGPISLAKYESIKVVEDLSNYLMRILPLGVFIENPGLLYRIKSTFAFEYMEGTSHVQAMNIVQSYRRGENI